MTMSKGNLELLAAGFSAILGTEVVPPSPSSDLPKLSIHDLFHLTYIPIPVDTVDAQELLQIHIKTLTGNVITVKAPKSFTIANVKAAVEKQEDIPARELRLVYSSKVLSDDETLEEAGVTHDSTIYLIINARQGVPQFQIDGSELAGDYDYDFRNKADDGKKYVRRGYVYQRPYGWYRYALNVMGKYKDNDWLGPGGIRTESSDKEWPVSYHGTNMKSAKKVGEKVAQKDTHGKGVYSSPSIKMIDREGYTQTFTHKGQTYRIALQNRVNPDIDNGHLVIIPPSASGQDDEYWISPKQDVANHVIDVRPYGVLVRQC